MEGRKYICRSYAIVFVDYHEEILRKDKVKEMQAEHLEGKNKRQRYKIRITDPMVEESRKRLLQRLPKYLPDTNTLDILSLALDPRTKAYALIRRNGKSGSITKDLLLLYLNKICEQTTELQSSPKKAKNSKEDDTKEFNEYGLSETEDSNMSAPQSDCQVELGNEVDQYLGVTPYEGKGAKSSGCLKMLETTDPLEWWQERKLLFPRA